MKKRTVNMRRIVMAAMLCIAGAATARADDGLLVANVPFDFVVGTVHLPAGRYIVKPAAGDLSVVEIEGRDSHQSAFALTIPAAWDAKVAQPDLVFEKRDNQYFLARVIPADGNEREIPPSHARGEHEVAVAPVNP